MSSQPHPSAPDEPAPYPGDTLGLPADEMRRLGHAVVDLVVDRLCNRHVEPAILTAGAAELKHALGGPIPLDPHNPDESIARFVDTVLAHQQHGDHPRYFARVPSPACFAAILGEWLGTGFNTIATSWAGSSGPSTVELVVLDWLRELLRLPEGTEGVLVSGGSAANLTAIAAARSVCGQGVAYLSDQTHASILRALKHLGFAGEEIRILASNEEYRLSPEALQRAVHEDRQRGLRPMLVIATAGTTNTAAVDPLSAIADVCRTHGLWFHVDGAYGAPAAFTDRGRPHFDGLEQADSLVLDPHKWLFQPYDIGCTLVSRRGALERAFSMNPEYLKDVLAGDAGEVDFRNRGLELTRRSRALKLWLTFRTYGLRRIQQAIERGIERAEFAERLLREQPQTWEIVTPAQLGIVTFARRGAGRMQHEAAAKALSASGFAAVTSTVLKQRSVLRLCTINPLTTDADIRDTLSRLAQLCS